MSTVMRIETWYSEGSSVFLLRARSSTTASMGRHLPASGSQLRGYKATRSIPSTSRF